MEDCGNRMTSDKHSLSSFRTLRNIFGAVFIAVIATLIANSLGYVPRLLSDPRILISIGLSTEDDLIDAAVDLMGKNPDHIHSRTDTLRAISLVFERDIIDRIADNVEGDPAFWEKVQSTLLARRIVPSNLEQFLAEAIRWREVKIPFRVLAEDHQRQGVGGPLNTTISGTDVPLGSIVVANLSKDFGYHFVDAISYPSIMGKGIRLVYYNIEKRDYIDVFAVENNGQFDPKNLPRDYNSEEYDYAFHPSEGFIFLTLGDEKQKLLSVIAKAMSLSNDIHHFNGR